MGGSLREDPESFRKLVSDEIGGCFAVSIEQLMLRYPKRGQSDCSLDMVTQAGAAARGTLVTVDLQG